MRRPVSLLLTWLLALLAGCGKPPAEVSPEGPTAAIDLGDGIRVARDGDRASYTGEMTSDGFAALRRLTDGHPIRTFVVNSAGGEITAGMDFGDWTFARRIDVVVEEMCLSSCANYIFPAARNKVIRRGAVVAWHGSARQRGLMEHLEQVIDGQVKSLAVTQQAHERLRIRSATADYLRRAQLRQDEFFERIRVDEYVTRIGNEEYGINGLYFLSLADMARYGITNVIAASDYERTDVTGLIARTGISITYLKLRSFKPCRGSAAEATAALASLEPARCAGVVH